MLLIIIIIISENCTKYRHQAIHSPILAFMENLTDTQNQSTNIQHEHCHRVFFSLSLFPYLQPWNKHCTCVYDFKCMSRCAFVNMQVCFVSVITIGSFWRDRLRCFPVKVLNTLIFAHRVFQNYHIHWNYVSVHMWN